MTALVRAAVIAGLLLLAGGTLVAPHQPVAGWTHQQLDHPPGALSSFVLGHLGHAVAAETGGVHLRELALASAAALSALTLAILAARGLRLWRPARGGVRPLAAAFAPHQLALAPPRLPPRSPFPL